MTIVRCDKCEKEIKSFDAIPIRCEEKIRYRVRMGHFEEKFDLCPECYKEILDLLGCEELKGTRCIVRKRD